MSDRRQELTPEYERGKLENVFESALFGIRYLTLIAVIGSFFASLMMYVKGSLHVLTAGALFFDQLSHFSFRPEGGHEDDQLLPILVTSVDNFLFATVLMIFSMGLYELFVSKINPVSRRSDTRPDWLNITSLDDLKSSLGKVILMILIVLFFEKSLHITYATALDLLYLGIGVLLVSGALYLTHGGKKSAPKTGTQQRTIYDDDA